MYYDDEFEKITQNKGHYAVQGHSRSPIVIQIDFLLVININLYFLSMLIYAAANQGRSSTSFIAISQRNRVKLVLERPATNHLCTYAHRSKLPEFVCPNNR